MLYNIYTTASFDVDPQKGFTPLCPDELPVSGGDEIVEELNKNAILARLRVGSKDAHNPNAIWVATEDKPQFSEVGEPNVDIRWNSHCNVGTTGFELLDGLPKPLEYNFFVYKGIEDDTHPYGACYHDLSKTLSTGVIEYLKYNGINLVIVGGLATDYCVFNTVIELVEAKFEVILNLESCRGVAPESTEAAIVTMKAAGVEVTTDIEHTIKKYSIGE